MNKEIEKSDEVDFIVASHIVSELTKTANSNHTNKTKIILILFFLLLFIVPLEIYLSLRFPQWFVEGNVQIENPDRDLHLAK
jgi:hypothetical protein